MAADEGEETANAVVAGLIGGVVATAAQEILSHTPAGRAAGAIAAVVGTVATTLVQAGQPLPGSRRSDSAASQPKEDEAMSRPMAPAPEWAGDHTNLPLANTSCGVAEAAGIVDCMPDSILTAVQEQIHWLMHADHMAQKSGFSPVNEHDMAAGVSVGGLGAPDALNAAHNIIEHSVNRGSIIDPVEDALSTAYPATNGPGDDIV